MAGAKAPKQRRPYRRWPISEQRRIVELTLSPGASARAIAREYGVSQQLVPLESTLPR
jgi:transposase-like protein